MGTVACGGHGIRSQDPLGQFCPPGTLGSNWTSVVIMTGGSWHCLGGVRGAAPAPHSAQDSPSTSFKRRGVAWTRLCSVQRRVQHRPGSRWTLPKHVQADGCQPQLCLRPGHGTGTRPAPCGQPWNRSLRAPSHGLERALAAELTLRRVSTRRCPPALSAQDGSIQIWCCRHTRRCGH